MTIYAAGLRISEAAKLTVEDIDSKNMQIIIREGKGKKDRYSYINTFSAKDPKYLSAEIGFTTILHTWEQNLMYHPHIHCIVPSGGLSLDGTRWINSNKFYYFYDV